MIRPVFRQRPYRRRRRTAILGLWSWIQRLLFSRPSHLRRIRQADRVLERLVQMRPGQRIAYLRRVDPFVFEELILTAFQREGCAITRNRRYTGDGGADGEVRIGGGTYLIQAKRYSSAIDPGHVRDFAALCRARRRPGLFVHTGRTGPGARSAAGPSPVRFISGNALLDLLDPHRRITDDSRFADQPARKEIHQ